MRNEKIDTMTFHTTAENSLEIKKKTTPVSELVHARILNALSAPSSLSKNSFSDHPNQTVERMSR